MSERGSISKVGCERDSLRGGVKSKKTPLITIEGGREGRRPERYIPCKIRQYNYRDFVRVGLFKKSEDP